MTVKEIITYSGAGLLLIASFIKIKPIEVNFWGWLGKKIGRTLKGEVITKIDVIEEKVDNLELRLKQHDYDNELDRVSNIRQRILRFNDEILHNQNHSQEHYSEILSDIDDYEDYCSSHPSYSNNKAVMSIQNIKDSYREHQQKQSFL